MPEEISVQILAKASENIQKLFDLSTRIDERVKAINDKQDNLDGRIEDIIKQYIGILQKVAVLESSQLDGRTVFKTVDDLEGELKDCDKRLSKLESAQATHADRWNRVGSFCIQLIWVILAAYVLTKLNLQPPAIP